MRLSLPYWSYWLGALTVSGAILGALAGALLGNGAIVGVGASLGMAAGAVVTGVLRAGGAGRLAPLEERRNLPSGRRSPECTSPLVSKGAAGNRTAAASGA